MAQVQSGANVTVGLKAPNGLRLRLFRLVDKTEVTRSGQQTISEAVQVGEEYVLNGNASPEGMSPQGYTVHGGYALTPNIPKEFFDEWMKQNKDSDLVRNKLIFAHSSDASAMAEGREKAETRSGFERLNPEKLPTEFVGKIKTAEKATA